MQAEKAIRALLMQDVAVTALVGDRCYPGELPEGCALPAVVLDHISTLDLETIGAGSYGLCQSRIEVKVLASSYVQQKSLTAAVLAACRYQRGVIAGVRVAKVARALTGPDLRDSDRGVFYQSTDFHVTFQEA
ncbi:DUF3168 domain-containing protein [Mitsuaria sp. WAJ17]|uniref:DUF3168 domain-containing protein n=1 Tax=Mitsuaria sp. WAJ17 TaxID=2761452 RepID=UPI00160039C8|nr:DUF3168 domain-containing protein [Mitsuaria sp. WAJ17]MBB2485406.1 DUF3168 domain-containing protein [Mitsuaria sp. WAJ17]